METKQQVGANVRAEMGRRGVTQAAVAERLGLPQTSVSKRLRGVIAFDVAEIHEVAELLDIPVSALFAGPAETEEVSA